MDIPAGGVVEIDEKGYLLDPEIWSPAVAEVMAAADGVALLPDHWAILEIFRDYYSEYEIEPPMRALVRRAEEALGKAKGNSRYLYQLFPEGPGTQACRYAGLPRPVSCL
ncbi:MAG: TusE/DsrC/DsvC family sulfur relay protein [Xanthomonadales bacterium]|nr:TusE/DsrC/DsvC family sulfur relay protein [Gammaproteobacteria bacterium]MBT8054513.1 TusE/DsrC/DsvC family sulfur relay protein [Gammaproteobacteria bacterium]NND56104.1 TusE/DsrC/DsvC family sulfur relay protein [Xanthomonadales bacterium]NNK52601.1 TusE/DsrC/DsvC family sulfur relay protein [Xanthomonadales bacterium]